MPQHQVIESRSPQDDSVKLLLVFALIGVVYFGFQWVSQWLGVHAGIWGHAISLWWVANAWWVIGLPSLLFLSWKAPKWVPPIFLAVTAVQRHKKEMARMDEDIRLQRVVTTKLEIDGFNTEYANQVTGLVIKSINPITLIPRMSSVTVSEERQEQKKLADPKLLIPEFPAPRDFADVLASGFRPSSDQVYLMDTVDGAVTSAVYPLTHVGLGGPTGGGKTNLTRLLGGQLLSDGVEASVYLASPNFAQVKLNGHRLEDWRPIVRRLAVPPAREADDIRKMLYAFKKTFETRKRQEDTSPRRSKDVFLILGEWPGIVARVGEAPEIVELLLREARQYGVHVITEMQDALVKSIGLSSGTRDNLRTGAYFGGDDITAKVLLNLGKGERVEETGLGQNGGIFLRTFTNRAKSGRVPFFSNRSLYMLLGVPPDPMPDGDIYDDALIPETYCQVIDGQYVGTPSALYGSPDVRRFYMPDWQPQTRVVDMEDLPRSTRNTGALETPVNPLVDTSGANAEDVPNLGDGDYQLNDLQIRLFATYYEDCGSIAESLSRIKNDRGQGLGSRYSKHASWLVKTRGIKKKERK